MKKIELLAPAGNMEAFKAAIKAGADAVYLGGKMFGARNYAGNFSMEEIKEATKYAHLYHVKVYVTVNTLIYEAEIPSLLKYVDELMKVYVDALIIEDIGVADLLHQTYPSLELHASTQMHIHNLEGVLFAHRLGCKRAVLARELSIEEITEIRKKSPIEIEVFGYGALCTSYSGQCLMSFFIGGRSGNRGTCAQCCRHKYKVKSDGKIYNQGEYPLSMKDLNTVKHLKSFIESGIDSLKIEGRMKRPEYVYLVTSIYRKAIDAYYETGKVSITEKDIKELYKIFNREFTKGFLFHEKETEIVHDYRPNHMGIPVGEVIDVQKNRIHIRLVDTVGIGDGLRILSNEDVGLTLSSFYQEGKLVKKATDGIIEIRRNLPVNLHDRVVKTSDEESLTEIRSICMQSPKLPIKMKASLTIGKPMELEVMTYNTHVKVMSKSLVQEASSSPLTERDIENKLSKLGKTPYFLGDSIIHVEKGSFLPIREVNELRREVISKLLEEETKRFPQEKGVYERKVPTFPQERKYSMYLSTERDREKYSNIDAFYTDGESRGNCFRKYPRVVPCYKNIVDKALVSDVGALYQFKEVITDFGIGVTNSYTLAYLHALGVQKVTLSYECNLAQTRKIIEEYHKRYKVHPNVEVIVKGKPEVMILKYDLLGRYGLSKGYLEDRFGHRYLVQRGNVTTIYSYESIKKDPEEYFEVGVNWVRYERE